MGAKFNKKITPERMVYPNSVYPDLCDNNKTTTDIAMGSVGGITQTSFVIGDFTVPTRNAYGDGDLIGAKLNLYINSITRTSSASGIPGLKAYKVPVNIGDREGGKNTAGSLISLQDFAQICSYHETGTVAETFNGYTTPTDESTELIQDVILIKEGPYLLRDDGYKYGDRFGESRAFRKAISKSKHFKRFGEKLSDGTEVYRITRKEGAVYKGWESVRENKHWARFNKERWQDWEIGGEEHGIYTQKEEFDIIKYERTETIQRSNTEDIVQRANTTNTFFDGVSEAQTFKTQDENANVTRVAYGDIAFSSSKTRTGGQSLHMHSVYPHRDTHISDIFYEQGTEANTENQQCSFVTKELPLPVHLYSHRAEGTSASSGQEGGQVAPLMSTVSVCLFLESIAPILRRIGLQAHGQGGVDEAQTATTLRERLNRSVVITFGEEKPFTGEKFYDYVKRHAPDATSASTNDSTLTGAGTNAKSFTGLAIVNDGGTYGYATLSRKFLSQNSGVDPTNAAHYTDINFLLDKARGEVCTPIVSTNLNANIDNTWLNLDFQMHPDSSHINAVMYDPDTGDVHSGTKGGTNRNIRLHNIKNTTATGGGLWAMNDATNFPRFMTIWVNNFQTIPGTFDTSEGKYETGLKVAVAVDRDIPDSDNDGENTLNDGTLTNKLRVYASRERDGTSIHQGAASTKSAAFLNIGAGDTLYVQPHGTLTSDVPNAPYEIIVEKRNTSTFTDGFPVLDISTNIDVKAGEKIYFTMDKFPDFNVSGPSVMETSLYIDSITFNNFGMIHNNATPSSTNRIPSRLKIPRTFQAARPAYQYKNSSDMSSINNCMTDFPSYICFGFNNISDFEGSTKRLLMNGFTVGGDNAEIYQGITNAVTDPDPMTAEDTDVTFVSNTLADYASTASNNKYVLVEDSSGSKYLIWYDHDGNGVKPAGLNEDFNQEIDISSTTAAAANIRAATQTAVADNSDFAAAFTISGTGAVLTMIDKDIGTATDAVRGAGYTNSILTVTTQTQGTTVTVSAAQIDAERSCLRVGYTSSIENYGRQGAVDSLQRADDNGSAPEHHIAQIPNASNVFDNSHGTPYTARRGLNVGDLGVDDAEFSVHTNDTYNVDGFTQKGIIQWSFNRRVTQLSGVTVTNDPLAAGGFTLNVTQISAGTTTIVVNDYLKIGSEIMKVTAITGTALTIVRGQDGTTAAEHANGAQVSLVALPEARENIFTSARITKVIDDNTVQVDSPSLFNFESDQEYILYIYNDTHASPTTGFPKTIHVSGRSNNEIEFRQKHGIPTDGVFKYLISPKKYWLMLEIHNHTNHPLMRKSNSNVALDNVVYFEKTAIVASNVADDPVVILDEPVHANNPPETVINIPNGYDSDIKIGDIIQIDDELMLVTNLDDDGSNADKLGVQRGMFGTTITTHAKKSILYYAARRYLPEKTYDSAVMLSAGVGSSSNQFTFGTTFNEVLYNDGEYINSWDLDPFTDETDTAIELKDYGFGEFDDETNSGGYAGHINLNIKNDVTTYKEIDVSGVIKADSITDNDTFTMLVSADEPTDSYRINIDTEDGTNPFFMTAVYEDKLPTVTNFKVQPNEKDAFFLDFTWDCPDEDVWYGFIHLSDRSIKDQYHGALMHIPFNDDAIEGQTISTFQVLDEFGELLTTAPFADTIHGTTSCLPNFTVEGLAGNAVQFDSNDVVYVGSSSDNNFADIGKEMSIVIHATNADPNFTSGANQYILRKGNSLSNTSIDVLGERVGITSQGKIVVRLMSFGDNTSTKHVELSSTSIIEKDVPMNIIITFDANLYRGNVKLFINGKLEDQSGEVLSTHAAGNNTGWRHKVSLDSGNAPLNIGSKKLNLVSEGWNGTIEEIVIYDRLIYPVEVKSGKFTLTKPLEELTAEADSSSKNYTARLFVKDYHNIRGRSKDEVATSAPISFRKAAFNVSGVAD